MGLFKPRYIIVSTYQDGERILEGWTLTRWGAEREAEAVRDFRADQDEGPAVTIEPAPRKRDEF